MTSHAVAEGSASGSTSPVPKWVWAAAIGGGIILMATGAAYYLFSDEAKRKSKSKTEMGSSLTEENGAVLDHSNDSPLTGDDPLERALAEKAQGNKLFRCGRYQLAIDSYSKAIDECPAENANDLAIFYQNRAAAYEQLENTDMVFSDCSQAIRLNKNYVKAMERRAKACRKIAETVSDAEAVEKLQVALEDVTAACFLESFAKNHNVTLIDTIVKELGRAEARVAVKTRQPLLSSSHFIGQYFQSFAEDPIMKDVTRAVGKNEIDQVADFSALGGFAKARLALGAGRYDNIVDYCTEEIERKGDFIREAQVLRGTFYILSKRQQLAFADFNSVIDDDECDPKLRANALIKRASLFIQQCKDPRTDPELSLADFATAEQIDPSNTDVLHHRGQVHLLIDKIDNAITDFSKAVELDPHFAIPFVQKLYTEYRQASLAGNSEEVTRIMTEFEGAIEKFPFCVESYALYAQVLNDQAQFTKADEMYQRAQQTDPENANLFVHRGLIAMQARGDVDTGLELLNRAIEKDDKCEFAYQVLGTVEVQRGNLKRAVELFNKAIDLATTELELAELFGLRDAALAQMSVANRLNVGNPTSK